MLIRGNTVIAEWDFEVLILANACFEGGNIRNAVCILPWVQRRAPFTMISLVNSADKCWFSDVL